MQVDIENTEESKCVVRVVFPKVDVERETTTVAQLIQPKANIKGFRAGAAPINVVKNFYRKPILKEVSQRLVYKGTSDALKEKKFKNVSNPELLEEYRANLDAKREHIGKFSLDGSFTFAVSVELPPEIDVGNYTGIEVDVESGNFDKWFESRIFEAQALYGDKQSYNGPTKVGDELVVDFTGSVDGHSLKDTAVNDQRLIIGQGMYMKEFESSFVGRKVGDDFSVLVKFPDSYNDTALAGKAVDFSCKIKEACEIVPHELNDELAQMMSYETLSELIEDYRATWNKDYIEPMRTTIYSKVMEKIASDNPFDVPEAWIDAELQKRLQQMGLSNMREQAQAMSALRELCEKSVRYAFLMDKIYEKETSLHISSEEFLGIVAEESTKHNISSTEMIEKLKAEGSYEGYVSFQEQKKVMDYLIDSAVIVEKEQIQ